MAYLTSLGRTTIIVSWVATTLAFVSLALGTAVNVRAERRIKASDYLNYVAFIIAVVLVAQNTFAILAEGKAEHQNELRDSQIDVLARSIIIHEALWSIVNALIRVSACITLKSMFYPGNTWIYWFPATICITILHALACILDLSLICRPISAQWNAAVNATCGNQGLSFILLEIMGIILDLIILIAPIYSIGRLQMSLTKKLWVSLIFELGALVLVISSLRLKALPYATSPDFVYSKSYLGLLSALGAMLSMIICVAPLSFKIFEMLGCTVRRVRLRQHTSRMPYVDLRNSWNTNVVRSHNTNMATVSVKELPSP